MLNKAQRIRMKLAEKGFEYTPGQVTRALAFFQFSRCLNDQVVDMLARSSSPKAQAMAKAVTFMRSLEPDIFSNE